MTMLVRCDLQGKFAHFRRFYTNSSSLSYPIPPPTVIRGLVAGALGWERQEYPERLKDLVIGIGIRKPVRSILQTVNALMIKDGSDQELRGFKARTQIPTQLFLPETPQEEWERTALCYRLLLLPPPTLTVAELAKALRSPVYPPALGSAFCLGWFSEVTIEEGEVGEADSDFHEYYGALDASLLDEIDLSDSLPRGGSRITRRLSRERYPFLLDSTRRLLEARDLVIDLRGNPIRARYRGWWVEIGGERWALLK